MAYGHPIISLQQKKHVSYWKLNYMGVGNVETGKYSRIKKQIKVQSVFECSFFLAS
jgi:hypothetical protein